MSLANESNYYERITHEAIHEIADDAEVLKFCKRKETKEGLRDLVANIIEKWEAYKEEYFVGR